jgi:hypothetical protein
MQKAKKDISKEEELKEAGLPTDREVQEAEFHKALGVVSRYLIENQEMNKHITYTNKAEGGFQMQTTVFCNMKFVGSDEDLKKHLSQR